MRFILLSFFTLVFFQTSACSCGGFDRVSLKDIIHYDFIFEGRVISDPTINKEGWIDRKEYKILVLKVFFGQTQKDTLTISTGLGSSDCGLNLDKGEKWLLFSNHDGKKYYSSICSKSQGSNSSNYLITKIFLSKYQSKSAYVSDKIQGHKIQGHLVNGNPDGEWTVTKNSDTVELVNFSNGLLNGRWIQFHEKDKPSSIRDYKDGLLHGVYEYYNTEGVLRTKFSYSNGKENGACYEYYDSGEIYRKAKYSNGVLIEDEIFQPSVEDEVIEKVNINFDSFKRELITTLPRPDIKWGIPNSILVDPQNKYFLVSYDFRPSFFELYEIGSLKKVNDFKARGHSYLFTSFFHEGDIYIDIGKMINIGEEKIRYLVYNISSNQIEKMDCKDGPLGCSYSASSPYRNERTKEYLTTDLQLMIKIEDRKVNVYRLSSK